MSWLCCELLTNGVGINIEAILCWTQISKCSDELQLIIYIFVQSRWCGSARPLFGYFRLNIFFFTTSQQNLTVSMSLDSARRFPVFLLTYHTEMKLAQETVFVLRGEVEEGAEWHGPLGLSGYKSLPSCLSKKSGLQKVKECTHTVRVFLCHFWKKVTPALQHQNIIKWLWMLGLSDSAFINLSY